MRFKNLIFALGLLVPINFYGNGQGNKYALLFPDFNGANQHFCPDISLVKQVYDGETGPKIISKDRSNKKPQEIIDKNARQFFLFSYFIEQDKGMYLALSTDGVTWETMNHGQVVLTPQVGSQKLMRDPSIHKGPDEIYRLVWTTGWAGKDIGYAFSSDLIHWSEQQVIPVGESVDSINNCWAPEIFYDDLKDQYMIYWSSNIGEWKKTGSEGRIYYVTTKDFKQFSNAKILFRNGFPAGGEAGNNGPIDAFIYKGGKARYIMFYKKDDNTGVPNDFYRIAATPEGPWDKEFGPIIPSTGDEGPSCVKVGSEFRIYTDPFEDKYAYLFSTTDLKNWQRRTTNLEMCHGTVIEIPKELAMKLRQNGVLAPKPAYRDPVYDGAADPVVIWNPLVEKWWMFYTNRRANQSQLPGVSWVHGTPIGIAESSDGANWSYLGTANFNDLPAECGGKDVTLWAPDVVLGDDGRWHMYLTIVPGIAETWGIPGFIAHLTSTNLYDWKFENRLSVLGTSILDADILKMPDGMWRMYYKDQNDYSSICLTESKDLYHWTAPKEVLKINGEGPIAFHWRGYYWLIIDSWKGQTVHRSRDGNTWERQPGENLLPDGEGTGLDDVTNALHANVVVNNDRVYMYYFTHPGRTGEDKEKDTYGQRRTSIQVVELKLNNNDWITADRNNPTYVQLFPPPFIPQQK